MSFSEARKSFIEEGEYGFDTTGEQIRPKNDRTKCCPIAYLATGFVGVGGMLFGWHLSHG